MQQRLSRLLAAIIQIEPHLTAGSVQFLFGVAPDGVTVHTARHHAQLTQGAPGVAATRPHPITLTEMEDLQPCERCLPEPDDRYAVDSLLGALSDQNLAFAVSTLTELESLVASRTVELPDRGPARLDAINNLALEFYGRRLQLDALHHRLLGNPAAPQHNHSVALAATAATTLLAQHEELLADPSVQESLQLYVLAEIGIVPDEEPTLVQLLAVEPYPEYSEPSFVLDDDPSQMLSVTLQVLYAYDTVLDGGVATIPAWAAQTMRLLRPDQLRSLTHRGLGEKERETALALWSRDPQDLYHHLDHCVTAARRLLDAGH